MSNRYFGGIVRKTPLVLDPAAGNAANGVFTMDQYMQAVKAGTWPAYDPYFEYTTLLLHGNGTNGAQNNTFLDSSDNNFTITRNGNTTQGTFSPFSKVDGRWGLRTNDRSFLTIPASSDFDLISTDYTIEFWWKLNAFNTMASSGNNFFGNGLATAVNGWSMAFSGSGATVTSIEFRRFDSGAQSANTFSGLSIPVGVWHHVALVRSGSSAGNLKLYVNGVQQGVAQTAVTYSTAGSTFTFGSGSYTQNATYSGNADYNISNVRLTKSALYTSDFTPSAAPLTQLSGTTLLMAQSNRLINNGTNAGAITSSGYTATRAQVTPFSPFPLTTAYDPAVNGGSGYFDGSGDFLTAPSNAAFQFGSGDFTMELSLYAASASFGNRTFLQYGLASVTGWTQLSYGLGTNASGNPFFEVSNGVNNPQFTITSSVALTAFSWNHIAIVRSGNDFTLYLNGTSVGTTNSSFSLYDPGASALFHIGRSHNSATSRDWPGYISNLRVVKGTAVYTSAFTPPTAPLTAITNTSLLTNFTNAGIFDNTGFNNLETVGNAQIDTSVKKYGTGSMEFDGTGDYLRIPDTDLLEFGSGNFTVELWANFTALPGNTGIVQLIGKWDNSSQRSWSMYIYNNGGTYQLYFSYTTNGSSNINPVGNISITTGVWYHFAAARSGADLKLFLDGTQVGSTHNISTSIIFPGTYPIDIGGSGTGQWFLNGYIDDLRITKGVARYTANFTPQTSQWQDQ